MAANNAQMEDKEIMEDVLTSQKHMTDLYNSYSNECVCQQLRDDMLNILREEHNIQASVFGEMAKRGWYAPPAAQQPKIEQAKTKYQNIGMTL